MTFLVGERVSCVIMRNNPLINQMSLHSIISHFVVVLANLLFHLLKYFCSMARIKQTPRKGDVEKEKKVREPSKWGTAAEVAFH